jgi:hypothetical protein
MNEEERLALVIRAGEGGAFFAAWQEDYSAHARGSFREQLGFARILARAVEVIGEEPVHVLEAVRWIWAGVATSTNLHYGNQRTNAVSGCYSTEFEIAASKVAGLRRLAFAGRALTPESVTSSSESEKVTT